MKYCFKCKGTGKILEQRLSDYVNSYDYFPVICPHCQEDSKSNSVNKIGSSALSMISY